MPLPFDIVEALRFALPGAKWAAELTKGTKLDDWAVLGIEAFIDSPRMIAWVEAFPVSEDGGIPDGALHAVAPSPPDELADLFDDQGNYKRQNVPEGAEALGGSILTWITLATNLYKFVKLIRDLRAATPS